MVTDKETFYIRLGRPLKDLSLRRRKQDVLYDKKYFATRSFSMQYFFKNNVIVDAVVFVDKRIIPLIQNFRWKTITGFWKRRYL